MRSYDKRDGSQDGSVFNSRIFDPGGSENLFCICLANDGQLGRFVHTFVPADAEGRGGKQLYLK
jgi:hypothetical protein